MDDNRFNFPISSPTSLIKAIKMRAFDDEDSAESFKKAVVKKEMDLGMLPAADLKKIFEKMECREYSEMHKTSKWVDEFLHTNLDEDLLFEGGKMRHLDIVLTVREDGEHFFNARIAGKNSIEIKGHGSSHFPLTIETNLRVPLRKREDNEPFKNKYYMHEIMLVLKAGGEARVHVNYNLINEFLIYLVVIGFKKTNILKFVGIKPTDRMLKAWKSKYIQVELKEDDRAYWDQLTLQGGPQNFGGVIDEGFRKLEKHCKNVIINADFEEQNDVLLPMLVDLTMRFHIDNILKRLVFKIKPSFTITEHYLDQYFGTSLVKAATGIGSFSRFFVYPGRDHVTFASVECSTWTRCRNPGLTLTCLNWKNMEEAMNHLQVFWYFNQAAEYPKKAWKQILLERFEAIAKGQLETETFELPGFIHLPQVERSWQEKILLPLIQRKAQPKPKTAEDKATMVDFLTSLGQTTSRQGQTADATTQTQPAGISRRVSGRAQFGPILKRRHYPYDPTAPSTSQNSPLTSNVSNGTGAYGFGGFAAVAGFVNPTGAARLIPYSRNPYKMDTHRVSPCGGPAVCTTLSCEHMLMRALKN